MFKIGIVFDNDNIVNKLKLKIRNNKNYRIEYKGVTYAFDDELHEAYLKLYVDDEMVFDKKIVSFFCSDIHYEENKKEEQRIKELLENNFDENHLQIKLDYRDKSYYDLISKYEYLCD